MSNLDIKINIRRLMDYSGSLDVSEDKKTLLSMIESFSSYVSELYLSMIQESIYSRRYKGEWEPVDDPEYVEYLGTTPDTHILILISEALEIKKIGYNFIIRFNPRYRYPGTRHYLVNILRAIDRGTSKFNARPIFHKIVSQIRSHIPELWKGYLSMKGVIN